MMVRPIPSQINGAVSDAVQFHVQLLSDSLPSRHFRKNAWDKFDPRRLLQSLLVRPRLKKYVDRELGTYEFMPQIEGLLRRLNKGKLTRIGM